MAAEAPACRVCLEPRCRLQATLISEIDGREYRVMRCDACGLVFAFPLPELSLDALQVVYGKRYTDEQRQALAGSSRAEALARAAQAQMDLVEQYVDRGTALTVGAIGSSAQVLQTRGWKLKIVDASGYAAETASSLWGLEVTVSRIEDYECPPASLDLIRLGHVIEHLRDPRLALVKMREMLRPGGVILIETDNAQGLRTRVEVLTRRILGEGVAASVVARFTGKNLRKRYGRLLPPEHLYVFSERNLSKLLISLGFEIVRVIQPAWGDPVWFPLTHREQFGRVERAFLALDRLGARMGAGEVLVILARR